MPTPLPKPKQRRKTTSKTKPRAKQLTPADLTIDDLRAVAYDSDVPMLNSMVQRALVAKKTKIKEEAK